MLIYFFILSLPFFLLFVYRDATQALRGNQTLRDLRLGWNGIAQEGTRALARMLVGSEAAIVMHQVRIIFFFLFLFLFLFNLFFFLPLVWFMLRYFLHAFVLTAGFGSVGFTR